jgi:multiple sugar transport system substrate-binding protein
MGMHARSIAGLSAVALAVALAGCGGDDSGSGGGSADAGGQSLTKGAKVIDVKAMDGAKGQVTLCAGKDTTGSKKAFIKDFNKQFASQGLSAKLIEFPESADEQRNQFVQRERAKSPECDVFQSDVIWTAEFARQKWLYDLTPYIKSRQQDFIPSTLKTAELENRYWAVPWATNAAFLYYRTDQVSSPPTTWQQVYDEAKAKDGIAYQGAAYEGLTVDFLELAFAAGGKVLSADGRTAVLDSPQNLAALKFMVDGVKDGAAPKAVTTYMEEPARRVFEAGKTTFMRNWPYAYLLGNQAPKIKGKFKVMPFPSWKGGGKAGILGGGNFVVSAYSKNPGGALKLIDFSTGPQMEAQSMAKFGDPAVLASTYDEPAVKKAIPFASELKQAVQQAQPRPVSPVYPLISEAIYKNVNAALSGDASPEAALKNAQAAVTKALKTF